jgi:hypothetical protein
MKDILSNLALIDLTNFCTEHGLHSSEGSHLVKNGRGFTYTLVNHDTLKPIASVTFHKHQVPTHLIHKEG